jgi:hypothetical protein
MAKLIVQHLLVAGASGSSESWLEQLSTDERRAMNQWAWHQLAEKDHGAVDLGGWPGWADAIARIQRDKKSAWDMAVSEIRRIGGYSHQ